MKHYKVTATRRISQTITFTISVSDAITDEIVLYEHADLAAENQDFNASEDTDSEIEVDRMVEVEDA